MAGKLSLTEMADYELLQQVNEAPKSLTKELAETLERDMRSVASRLAWMKRMGLVDRGYGLGWVLSSAGRNILNGFSEDLMEVRDITARARRSKSMRWVVKREFTRDLT